MKKLNVDLCVIGAGSGGLSVAAGAAQLGSKVILIEADKMGGDCLNYGCIPSKTLLSAAKLAQEFRDSAKFGISASQPNIQFEKVMKRVQEVISTIGVHDSVERFTELGVKVINAQGKFTSPRSVIAGDFEIHAKNFVIATGSTPSIPNIEGLKDISFLTNETIFNLKENPSHLMIIGGGPIGCELAQAFLYLGCKVSMLEAFHVLPKDERNLVEILKKHLISKGLQLIEEAKIKKIIPLQNETMIQYEKDNQSFQIVGSHLLVATGRKPKIDTLNLEAAKVSFTEKGIKVNSKLRTSNKHIYVIGDATGNFPFTHMANYHAGIVIRNSLFHLPSKVDYQAIPWVTYTEPELAHAGLLSDEAFKIDPKAQIIETDFYENDRAQTEGKTLGKIKLILNRKGKVLGVSILGQHAGELLLPWIMMIREKKSLRAMTDVIIPYPTLSEISKKVASEFYKPILFSERTKKLIRFLKILG